jgi:hypothetical protein
MAGTDWLAGADLYRNDLPSWLEVYRYGPTVAAFMAPLALIPESVGSVLWRLLNAAVFLGAFAWWLRAAAPRPCSPHATGLLYLLLLPLAVGSLNNAQPNVLLTGLLLAALAGVARQRWNLAAFCLAGAVVLKLYPLALALLLLVVYPRQLLPRLLVALLALAALPFLLQEPDYVMRQYHLWWVERLHTGDEARRYWPLHAAYRDLWLLFRVLHVPISLPLYELLQIGSGLGCGLIALVARWKYGPTAGVLLLIWTLGSCWMMLFGPATESSTYVLLAPCLAWILLSAWQQPWPSGPRWTVTVAGVLFLVSVLAGVGPWVTTLHGLAIHPLATVLLLVGVGWCPGQMLGAGAPTRSQGSSGPFPKIYPGPEDRAA